MNFLEAQSGSKSEVSPPHAAGPRRSGPSPSILPPIPREWNGITVPFPRERTVLDYFKALVQSQPQAIAVKDGSRPLPFAELDGLSRRVAQELQRHGVKLEESVVILLPASAKFLAAVLGVLKVGGTYFPIDVGTPAKRLEFLLQDSETRLVLSDESGRQRLQDWAGTVLDLAQILRPTETRPASDTAVPTDPERRAYITYTSGSTGLPKGVQIEHHALTNLVWYYHQRLELSAADRTSMLAYVAFDASVADIWPVLCAGGTVIIPPPGILLEPDGLIAWLVAEQITVTFVPTGLAEILFARPWPQKMPLRFLITGGDRLRVRPPAGLPFRVINGYGPTETTVFSTWSVVQPEDGTKQPPPIGRPLTNTTAYVLDDQLQPLPVGVAGELFLGGEQVARGYINRPELTAEKFLPDPFASQPAARMYRTGDWVQWRPDGELDFLGRRDGQIQIRGRRVELGEIEATLYAHGALRQVCCVPRLDDDMPSGVIAHVVPVTPHPALIAELRAYLTARLPDYMLPAEIILHEQLPLTPQGKIDRAALMARQPVQPTPVAAPQSPESLETALTQLWHSLLPAATGAPADSSFVTLGGDSLLAIKLMLGVEEITQQRLEVSTFLMQPTLPGLLAAVQARQNRASLDPVLPLRPTGTRPPLFCLYGYAGDIEVYFNLAEALGEDQPVIGIRSPALEDLSRLPDSMETAAAEMIRLIRDIQPQGAPALVGFSWAGQLAFEVARQLQAREGLYCYAAVIGTTAPLRSMSPATRLGHFVRAVPAWLLRSLKDPNQKWRRPRAWRIKAGEIKRFWAEVPLPLEKWIKASWGSAPVARHLIGLLGTYRPMPGPTVPVYVFLERDNFPAHTHPFHPSDHRRLPDGGWGRWVGDARRIRWLPGNHETIMKPPQVSALAQSIRATLDEHLQETLRRH